MPPGSKVTTTMIEYDKLGLLMSNKAVRSDARLYIGLAPEALDRDELQVLCSEKPQQARLFYDWLPLTFSLNSRPQWPRSAQRSLETSSQNSNEPIQRSSSVGKLLSMSD